MNGPNILLNNNNINTITNQKSKKPLKKLLFTTKQEITILTICILSFVSQIGVYYCLYQIENNGLLIVTISSATTWIISIPFILGGFEKYKYQKYLHLGYIIIQSFLVLLVTLRLSQYTCYVSIFRTLGLNIVDPLKNIQDQFLEEGLPDWEYLYLHTVISATFLIFWLYSIRTAYNLYRRVNIVRIYEKNQQEGEGVGFQNGKGLSNIQNMMGNGNNCNPQNVFTIPTTTNNIPIIPPLQNPSVIVK